MYHKNISCTRAVKLLLEQQKTNYKLGQHESLLKQNAVYDVSQAWLLGFRF